jgi:hypothetical protein
MILAPRHGRLNSFRRPFFAVAMCVLVGAGVGAESPLILQLLPRWEVLTLPFEPAGQEETSVRSSLRYEPLWIPRDAEDRAVRTWVQSAGSYTGSYGAVGVEHTLSLNDLRSHHLDGDVTLAASQRDQEVVLRGTVGPPIIRVAGAIGGGTRETLAVGLSSRSRLGRFDYTYRRMVTPAPVSLRVTDRSIISPSDAEYRRTVHSLGYRHGDGGVTFVVGAGLGEAKQDSQTYRLMGKNSAYWARLSVVRESIEIDALAGVLESSVSVRRGNTQYGDLDQLRGVGATIGVAVPTARGFEFSGRVAYAAMELAPPNYLWTVPFLPGGSWYYYRVRNMNGNAYGFASLLGVEYAGNLNGSTGSIDGTFGLHLLPFLLRSHGQAETALMYPSKLPDYETKQFDLVNLDGSLARVQVELATTFRRLTLAAGAAQWIPLFVRRQPSNGRVQSDDAGGAASGPSGYLQDIRWAGTQITASMRLAW